MLKQRKCIQALIDYEPGTAGSHVLQKVYKLSSNENPLGCPNTASELKQTIQEAYLYPNSIDNALVHKLEAHYGCNANQFLLGNGSDDIFQLAALSLLEPGDQVISSEFTFSIYQRVSQIMGAKFTALPISDGNS